MSRDHRRLRVFHLAHQLVLCVYRETQGFPRDEWYGLRAQLRRSAVSTACNLVEGSARRGSREYVNFVNLSRASAAETAYLIALASELGYVSPNVNRQLQSMCDSLIPQLELLIQKLDELVRSEEKGWNNREQSIATSSLAPKAQGRKPTA